MSDRSLAELGETDLRTPLLLQSMHSYSIGVALFVAKLDQEERQSTRTSSTSSCKGESDVSIGCAGEPFESVEDEFVSWLSDVVGSGVARSSDSLRERYVGSAGLLSHPCETASESSTGGLERRLTLSCCPRDVGIPRDKSGDDLFLHRIRPVQLQHSSRTVTHR